MLTLFFVIRFIREQIKVIEIGTKRCTTLIGDGLPGNRVGGFQDGNGNAEQVASVSEPFCFEYFYFVYTLYF